MKNIKTLNKNDILLFEKILQLSEKTLKQALKLYLQKKYDVVIESKNYLVAEGNIPIALCAHLDTVFHEPPIDIYYDDKKNVMLSPDGGSGFDDRAGVFAILKILKTGLRPHIIFTCGEETGGVGANELARNPMLFKDLRYIIELDRRGSNDCVFYYCENAEFEEYVSSFGFVTNYGTYSDICNICPAWGVAGVNLSIGYEHEHTYRERLYVGQMLSTIEKVKTMLLQDNIPSFEYREIIDNKRLSGFSDLCDHCSQNTVLDELYVVNKEDGTQEFWCIDCISIGLRMQILDWCDKCQYIFTKHSDNDTICGKCLHKGEDK